MPQFSSRLTRLLIIRGIARALMPLAILWAVYDWYLFDRLAVPPRFPWRALVFALLTGNFVLVYVLSWVAPGLLNGPWRVRAWQTFILLANAVFYPAQHYRHFGTVPWGFVGVWVLAIIGLYAGTAIWFYMQDRLPMAGAFAARKALAAASARATLPASAS
ncbi:MAG: hypothetical protein HRF43_10480 [Phycisphaerae bacterium]|jgi:hypothetical protein